MTKLGLGKAESSHINSSFHLKKTRETKKQERERGKLNPEKAIRKK